MKLNILKGDCVEVAGVPDVIAVLPLGHVTSSKGEFEVTEESLTAMKALVKKKGVDLVVDYEHQTLAGTQAPAAGWVKELFLRDGHICARVEWTPKAKEYLANKEYRYLSPVVSVRESDDLAVGLHSLALTNTPAIEHMKALVNSDNHIEGGTTMELLKQLAALLGLPEDADEATVLGTLKSVLEESKALKEKAEGAAGTGTEETVIANKAVCELLNLKAGAPVASVITKIQALKAGAGDGNVLEELKALKAQMADRNADDAVMVALKAGKITYAQKEWAKSYALSDPKGFDAFVAAAPRVVPAGEIQYEEGQKALKDQPDEATLAVCKQLGITQEDLGKYGKE